MPAGRRSGRSYRDCAHREGMRASDVQVSPPVDRRAAAWDPVRGCASEPVTLPSGDLESGKSVRLAHVSRGGRRLSSFRKQNMKQISHCKRHLVHTWPGRAFLVFLDITTSRVKLLTVHFPMTNREHHCKHAGN